MLVHEPPPPQDGRACWVSPQQRRPKRESAAVFLVRRALTRALRVPWSDPCETPLSARESPPTSGGDGGAMERGVASGDLRQLHLLGHSRVHTPDLRC